MASPERSTGGGERLTVGLVRGIHGLRGAVRVEVLTDEPSRFEPGSVLWPEGHGRELTVAWAQADEPGLLVRFEEISSREAAETLRDRYLEIEPEGALPEGAYYWHEVVGASVRTGSGEELGRVEEVFRAGDAEVYVVRGGDRGEVLVPAVGDVIERFEPRAGLIEVDAGALDLEPVTPRRMRGRRSSKLPAEGAAEGLAGEEPTGEESAEGPTTGESAEPPADA